MTKQPWLVKRFLSVFTSILFGIHSILTLINVVLLKKYYFVLSTDLLQNFHNTAQLLESLPFQYLRYTEKSQQSVIFLNLNFVKLKGNKLF